jgi:hypothetical protein
VLDPLPSAGEGDSAKLSGERALLQRDVRSSSFNRADRQDRRGHAIHSRDPSSLVIPDLIRDLPQFSLSRNGQLSDGQTAPVASVIPFEVVNVELKLRITRLVKCFLDHDFFG